MKSFELLLAFVLLVTQTTPFVGAVKPDTSWEKKLWYGPVKVPTNLRKCEVPHASDSADDSAAIVQVFQQCNRNSEIVFKKGVKYNAWNPMNWGNLSSVVITLDGSIHLPNNITDIQSKVTTNPNPPSGGSGDSYDVGAFHGYGQQWWNVNIRTKRPQLATFNVTNGSIAKIKVIKPVAWGFNIPGTNITIKDHFVDAAPTNGTRDLTPSFPFNTDGFNMGGKNISLDGYYGHNGDDCVSIVNGAKGVVAKNGFCGFSSHGLSIGSLGRNGSNHQVSNVLFQDWTMDEAVYGARFKSWTGGNGLAENITWRNIHVNNVSTPIFVTQNYYDQDFGRPNNTANTSTHVNNMLFENFWGTIGPNPTDGTCISNPCWNYVAGANGTQAIIFDLYNGTATNLHAHNIQTKPIGKQYKDTTVICDPATLAPGEQDGLGFLCQNGPFKATSIKR
ncbi:7968_t:CDS:2 [Acaulospora colombiana]|uniref:7968_t:CDS:1 n=1 Tax=Acaulospora colombiana TaxID=27376 RepID=A0ACA9NH51_9GLOM|nr:7968_t:CDS:2 [Acaulospora colombiana]